MSSSMNQRILANPKFQQLVATRGRYAWTLSIIVLAVFYGFVLLVAFNPKLIGSPIAEGSAWTVGIVGGLFIFISFWLLTALYVRRANTEFDATTQEIIREAWQEHNQ